MTIEMRHRAILTALSIIVATAVGACGKQEAEEVDSESVVAVKTAPATIGNIRGVIHATGVVTPAPGADLMIVAPEAARIAEIPRAVGDRVRRGDLLVRFEIPSAAAEVERQQAEVIRAQAMLNNAGSAQTRAADLFERGVTARREVEDSNRAVAEAEAALVQARSSLIAAQAAAGRAIVRATFNGIVAKRLHNPGDLVEASSADPVLRVIDPDRLEVVASVPLGDASRIEMGAPGHLVSAPIDAREIGLKVLSRPAAVEPGTATVPVRLGPARSANLPAGSPVQLDIEAEQHNDVVLIPADAIVREGDETAVFVADGEKARRRPVAIGLTNGTHVEIVSGVKAGELVIVDGQAGLPDGAAITVKKEGA
jgi:RND family efflux transporter MFP subunit